MARSVEPSKNSTCPVGVARPEADDEGETVADVFYRDPPHPRAPELKPDDNGWIWLPDNAFPEAFAQHATAHDHALLTAVQRPINVPCIQKPVPRPGWKDIPTWFLIAEEDRMINPDTQRFMAERIGACEFLPCDEP